MLIYYGIILFITEIYGLQVGFRIQYTDLHKHAIGKIWQYKYKKKNIYVVYNPIGL